MAKRGSVRRRVRAAIVGTVALALLLVGLPLGAAVALLYRDSAESRLEAEAAHVLVAVPDDRLSRPGITLPRPRDPSTHLALYDGDGNLLSGQGPRLDPAVRAADGSGGSDKRLVHGEVVVIVPFSKDDGGRVVVRAASSDEQVVERTYLTWLAMVLVAGVVIALAWFVGSRRARALAQPFEQLTADAQALGRGNFAVRGHSTGLLEADAASAALEETARRLGALLERERAFSSDASHQLRTPLTRLRLGLESALLDPTADRDEALRRALQRLDGLETTVTSLLALARDTGGEQGRCDVGAAVRDAGHRWQDVVKDSGRELVAQEQPDLPDAACAGTALSQVVDVLLDNALQHGRGTVTVTARRAGPGVALDVADEGDGLGTDPERAFTRRSADARGNGIGLALARSLTEAEGGRLVVGHPGSVLSVLLPAADHSA